MTDYLLNTLKTKFVLKEKEINEYKKVKVGPMKFKVRQFEIEGVGNLAIMEGIGMLGMIKMDTVMLSSLDVDAPFFSYDIIHAMGKHTVILELYNTQLEDIDLSSINDVNAKYISLRENVLAHRWYDSIKYPQSISKWGRGLSKKKDIAHLTEDYISAVTEVINTAKKVEQPSLKIKKVDEYADGLINNGGVSTDQFVKHLGEEKTRYFFKHILFGTEE